MRDKRPIILLSESFSVLFFEQLNYNLLNWFCLEENVCSKKKEYIMRKSLYCLLLLSIIISLPVFGREITREQLRKQIQETVKQIKEIGDALGA